jgi:hypothetical protein
MSDKERIELLEAQIFVLREGLDIIREATFAEFQEEAPSKNQFNVKKHACPWCRRASTIEHLRLKWALIQAEAARLLNLTEP